MQIVEALFEHFVDVVLDRMARLFRAEQQLAGAMDEERVEFAAFDQIERSNLFEFVAQVKPVDEQIA